MNSRQTDHYVRNKLSDAEQAAYELRLLESPELQDELEATLALQQALRLEKKSAPPSTDHTDPVKLPSHPWQNFALAASLAVVAISLVLVFSSRQEISELNKQIIDMGQPRTVLNVPVQIMRSAGDEIPDVIIQIPSGHAAVLLDIELSGRSAAHPNLQFALQNEPAEAIISWASSTSNNRSSFVLNAETLPTGKIWLRILDASGAQLERRLLEFRAPE